MSRTRLTAERAFRLFAEALQAFSDEPGPENLERYLAASRLLEESRRPRLSQARDRVDAKGADAA
jgi:hypothetical protein